MGASTYDMFGLMLITALYRGFLQVSFREAENSSLPSGPFSPSGTTHSHTPIHARPAPLMPFSTHTA